MRLVEVEVARIAAVVRGGVQVRPRLPERVAGEVQPGQREDQRIAAGHAHGHEVRVVLHLPRKRRIGEVDDAEQPFEHLPRDPQDAGEGPREDGDADVRVAEHADEIVQRVAAVHDVADHAVGGVNVGAELHAPLREVPEFVGEHGLELGEVQPVHEAEPDDQVLLPRHEQVEDRLVVRDGGVHLDHGVDAVRERSPRVVAQLADEREEVGFVRIGEFDAEAGVAVRTLEKPLHHEEADHGGSDAADDEPERVFIAEAPRGLRRRRRRGVRPRVAIGT